MRLLCVSHSNGVNFEETIHVLSLSKIHALVSIAAYAHLSFDFSCIKVLAATSVFAE